MKEQLIKDRDEIKGLISEIAHQLRNPLANMEGYLRLLEEGAAAESGSQPHIDAIAVSERRIRFLDRKALLNGQAGEQGHPD